MLKKANRLSKNKEFNRLFKSGRSAYGESLGLKVAPNELGLARVAILVNKKVSKRAVKRNLIKRRLRDIFQQNWLTVLSGYDTVIICLPKTLDKTYLELEKELAGLVARIKK